MVQGCDHTKKTFWTEDEFTVTGSPGIRNRDVRVAEIVARELEKAKRRSRELTGEALKQIHGMGTRRYVLSVDRVQVTM
jgi:hypothetical protein